MRVAVIGGAGYIGSHTVVRLLDVGHEPVVIDNLSRGHRAAVDAAARAGGVESVPLHTVDMADEEGMAAALQESGAEAVMHFAAFAYVGESVTDPERYYFNNVVNTLKLLRAMRRVGVDRFVFSSSCTVYGVPETVPITEGFPLGPISPYGHTKADVEEILADYAPAYGLRYASLRYFNASGAMPDGSLGEDHDPEPHLIPCVIRAATGQGGPLVIFGTDYPTHDGTCVRDYIHVLDLAQAHVLALEAMGERPVQVYNLSTGQGFSVREVVHMVQEVTDRKVPVEMGARRPGDPPELVGSHEKIHKVLGWEPAFPRLQEIVESAWEWHRTHPDGYGD